MRFSFIFFLLMMLSLCCIKVDAQSESEKLDLPGDNLNLYAALKLFQESATIEGFEKSLNDEKSNINNLDLDGDNNIDYIKVIDNPDGDVHNITLKIAVSKDEDQDVAVFVVNKEPDGKVQIQVIGDEDLYGKDYIIEPDFESSSEGTPNPGYTGNPAPVDVNDVPVQTAATVEIATWPVVRFIFVPAYVAWHSPWRWHNYPSYWRPWRPFYWHYYYGYHYHWTYYYNTHYRRWHNYRIPGWREHYYGGGFRSQSIFVRTRYTRGDYKKTYTKPELAKQGAAVFKKDFPKATHANNKLPEFDKTGRPVITRPVTTRPITTQPGVTNPGENSRPGITRPVTKPGITKPVTRPVITNPGTRPVITRPGTKPVIDRPAVKIPAPRPAVIKPVHTKPATSRPVTRPVNTRPATNNPAIKPRNTPAQIKPARDKN